VTQPKVSTGERFDADVWGTLTLARGHRGTLEKVIFRSTTGNDEDFRTDMTLRDDAAGQAAADPSVIFYQLGPP
jgi:hypothetical protein